MGQAGEHLVRFELSLRNLENGVGSEGGDFDVWARIGGKVRTIQVKTTENLHIQEGRAPVIGMRSGGSRNTDFCDYAVDILAFVYLPPRIAIYCIADTYTKVGFRSLPEYFGRERSDFSLDNVIKHFEAM